LNFSATAGCFLLGFVLPRMVLAYKIASGGEKYLIKYNMREYVRYMLVLVAERTKKMLKKSKIN
jgi:hypothetical protein